MTKNTPTFNLFLLLFIAVFFIRAVNPVENKYDLSKDYEVTIHGTSNLHNWDEKVETVSGNGVIKLNTDGSFELENLNIKLDVHSIKSNEGSIMNNNTYKALKADAYPEIIFALNVPVKAIQSKSSGKLVSVKGNLTIAGVKRSVDMLVKIVMQENGKLIFEGSQTIKMSDYGIDPPTALFGTLKTGNEITINFKTVFIITAK